MHVARKQVNEISFVFFFLILIPNNHRNKLSSLHQYLPLFVHPKSKQITMVHLWDQMVL